MANAEQAEKNNYGSFVCVYCGETFSADNPCWNSFADYEDGSHADGECRRCAEKRSPEWRPTSQHERGE